MGRQRGAALASRRLLLEAVALALHLASCSALRIDQADSGDKPAWKKCAWRQFGEGYLQGVQYIPTATDHFPFQRFDHGSDNKEGLFVYPEAKLAMCIIEKNGCSTWTTLFNRLVHKNTIKSPWYGIVPFFWSERKATQVFQDKKSARIVWVREPLERFLSAFLEKCAAKVEDRDFRHICPFHLGGVPGGFPISQVMFWFAMGGKAADWDSHFTPQSWHCELRRRLREYNVIGLMTKANFSRDASCIAQRAHLGGMLTDKHGDLFFQKKEATAEQEARRVEILKRFFTRELAEKLMDFYKEDYELFRIEKPAWVQHATGEWYHEEPRLVRRLDGGEPNLFEAVGEAAGATHEGGQGGDLDGDLNDIELLAARAGFRLPP